MKNSKKDTYDDIFLLCCHKICPSFLMHCWWLGSLDRSMSNRVKKINRRKTFSLSTSWVFKLAKVHHHLWKGMPSEPTHWKNSAAWLQFFTVCCIHWFFIKWLYYCGHWVEQNWKGLSCPRGHESKIPKKKNFWKTLFIKVIMWA